MLDPSSALVVHHAILRFLDTSANCIEALSRAEGGEQEVAAVESETEALKEVGSSEDISTTHPDHKSTPEVKQTDAERATQKIYERASEFAIRLVHVLQSYKGADGGHKRDKPAGELEKSKKELETSRLECSKCLLQLLNNRLSASVKKLDELRHRDAGMEANVSLKYEKHRQELLTALNHQNGRTKPFRPLSLTLGDMLEDARKVRAAQDVLLSLRFEGMEARKHTIAETHGDTYEWLFTPPKSLRQKGVKANFPDWLENGQGIFWVTGYPGSGKSTLMKFVDNHHETKAKLSAWASGFRLVKASHFFWVNGSPLQKSQAGLLRSLCFDILRQCPDLLPQLCEKRWNDRGEQSSQEDWDLPELEQMLVQLQTVELKVHDERVRFCFLIDGLDEYAGDHDELLENLRQLATSPHIKICAASRPWNLFEDAFGQDPAKMLTMQDLTNDDIETYVKDTLGKNERFSKILKEDSNAQSLIDAMIDRANGVFLWVHLVVTELQKRLSKGDGLKALEGELNRFPSNLDEYFQHMLDTMDVFYQQKTAQLFRLCIRARQPLALAAFSVLDRDDSLAGLFNDGKDLDKQEIADLQTRLRKQIEDHGPELLEVVNEGNYAHVQFTHRTVRDFLTHNNMDSLFAERAGADFYPLETLCRMSLLTIQNLNLLTKSTHTKDIYLDLIGDILDYAQDTEIAESKAAFRELNQLEEYLEHNRDITGSLDTNRIGPILPLAIRQNLCLFVKQRAEYGPGTLQPVCSHPDRPLLSFALPVFKLRHQAPPDFWPEMVQILLKSGSDPNEMSWIKDEEANVERRAPIWSLYLRTLHSLHKRPKMRPQGSLPLVVTEAIIEAGAYYAPACLTEDGNKGEKEILSYVFGQDEAERLLSLRAQPVKTARTGSGTGVRPSWAKSKSFLRRMSTGQNAA